MSLTQLKQVLVLRGDSPFGAKKALVERLVAPKRKAVGDTIDSPRHKKAKAPAKTGKRKRD